MVVLAGKHLTIMTPSQPADLIKYHWFHGEISEEQATWALNAESGDCFLVRQTASNLVLSKKIRSRISHNIIHYSPGGYHLERIDESFETIPELLAHYLFYPINESKSKCVPRTTDTLPSTGKLCINLLCNTYV